MDGFPHTAYSASFREGEVEIRERPARIGDKFIYVNVAGRSVEVRRKGDHYAASREEAVENLLAHCDTMIEHIENRLREEVTKREAIRAKLADVRSGERFTLCG